jgi:hypothetical protein
LLDGPLHDNRLEAKADAAINVTEAYRKKLIETANEQAAKSREGQPQDLDTVRQVVIKSRATLQNQYKNALDSLKQAENQAISQATETKNRLLQEVNQSLNATLNALAQQQVNQLRQLDDYGQQQKMAIARDVEHVSASLQQGITEAAKTLQGTLQGFIGNAQKIEAPNEDTLLPVLEQFRTQFDGTVTQAQLQYQQSTTLSIQGVNNSGQQANQTLNQFAQGSIEEISTGAVAFTASMGQITQRANTTFTQIQSTHSRTAISSTDSAVKGFQDITNGIKTLFSTLNQRLEDGFKKSATGLEGSLRQVLSGKLENDITTKAIEAAAQVQPRWKTVLKVLLVIVVIIVVALVIGPAVIGAVGAFAGAMGASAAAASFIGATVGGAIVGAAAGATIQMGNNIIDGKNLLHDVGKAALVGAIGGALGGFGGALGQFLANTGRLGVAGLGQTVLKFGIDRVFDVAGGIAGNVAVGDPVTLEGILTGVAIAGAVSIAAGSLNSLGKFGGKIQAIQEGSFNAGADFGGATGAKVSGALGIKPNNSGGQTNAGSSAKTAKEDGNSPTSKQSEVDNLSSQHAKDEGNISKGNQSDTDNTSSSTTEDNGSNSTNGQSETDSAPSSMTKDDAINSTSKPSETDGSLSNTAKDDGSQSHSASGQSQSDSTSGTSQDSPKRIIRQDNEFSDLLNSKGKPKSHLTENGSLSPANPEGSTTPLEHVYGMDPAKGESPYTSFLTEEGGIAKPYGKSEIELDLLRLHADTKSGKVKGVEILAPEEVSGMIRGEINKTPGIDIEAALSNGPQGIAEYVDSKGLSKGQSRALVRRLLAYYNTTRDGEYLIRGVIPSEYLNGPYPVKPER